MAAEHITTDNFDEKVISSGKTVLVDFFAEWCGPCKKQGPVIDEMAGEQEEFGIYKVDVDANNELAQKYSILSIPTLLVFKGGEEKKRIQGFHEKEALFEELKNA